MAHYDEDVHCKICGEYLGTYNMLCGGEPREDEKVCKNKRKCKLRKVGKIRVRPW